MSRDAPAERIRDCVRCLLVPLAAVGQGSLGNVSWSMVGALILGSLRGVWIEARVCKLLGDAWLRPTIVVVLAIAGSRLL